jgi:CRP-like cAMP-binding protein
MKTTVSGLVKRIPAFSGLKEDALSELNAHFVEKFFKKGQLIMEEGSAGDSMMIILSGAARVTQVTGASCEEALVVLKEGEMFGEMALLEGLPRSATVIAQVDVRALEISKENFMGFIQNNSSSGNKILLNICRILSSRLRETDTKLKAFVNFSQWV